MKRIEITMSVAEEPKPRKEWVTKSNDKPLKTMMLAKAEGVDVFIAMEGDPFLTFKRGEEFVGMILYDRATPDWLQGKLRENHKSA